MPSVQSYPPLSTILRPSALPAQLSFIKDELQDILDHLFYRNLQVRRSTHGDEAFYSLEVLFYRTVNFRVPGTEMRVILNPDPTGVGSTTMSVVPAEFHYKWEILRYVHDFDISTFKDTAESFYELALDVFGISERNLLRKAIETFVPGATPSAKISAFVSQVNAAYFGASITAPGSGSTDPYQDLVDEIRSDSVLKGIGATPVKIVLHLYILSSGDPFDNIEKLYGSWLADNPMERLREILTPQVDGSIKLSVGVEFPRTMLLPMKGGTVITGDEKSMLIFQDVDFKFSSSGDIGFDGEPSASLNYVSQIPGTGFTIDLKKAKLDLSRKKNIKEADLDGRPVDFTGVYIEEVAIGLPSNWSMTQVSNTALKGKKLLIGVGGLSGEIALENTGTNPIFKVNIGGGFVIDFTKLSVTFKQGKFTKSDIKGSLTIPGFTNASGGPAKIDLDATIEPDGFKFTASSNPPVQIKIANVLTINISSITIGRKNPYYLDITGSLQFAPQGGAIGNFLPSAIEINKLRIWEDGQIEFDGGSLVLPRAVTVAIGPVALTVTALHLGSHEQVHNNALRKYKYFGFDGGISVNPGGVDARGDGIKFYFTVDSGPLHVFMRIQSIAIDLVIPGSASRETATVLLNGYLSMKDGGGSTEYTGGVAFTLPKVKMGGSAAMRLNPKKGAFLVDIGLELSTPILLGTTGLGIYGFRGLIGQKYVADKSLGGTKNPDVTDWWEYYKSPVGGGPGINVGKFAQQDGFSVGAGVSLATAADGGRTFSSRLFLLLSLPEVLLLQGQASILSQRVGLDGGKEPPFSAIIAIDRCSVQAGFGVKYRIPDGGEILTLDAEARLGFFSCGGSAWYINIGQDEPASKRLRARLFTIIDAYAYLMLSASGIRAGAGASWELNKKFGPVGIELGAYLDTGGRISFKPVQIGAFIRVGGYARLRVFKFKFGLDVSASLSGEAPKPFIVTGSFAVTLSLPWPFPDVSVSIELTWAFVDGLNTTEVPLLESGAGDDPERQAAKALNIMSQEPFKVAMHSSSSPALPGSWPAALNNFPVPMDCYVDIEFMKGVFPDRTSTSVQRFGDLFTGADNLEFVPPQKAKNDQVKHEFHVRNIFVKYWDNGTWKDYDIYLAQTPLRDIARVDMATFQSARWGYFQMTQANRYNRLRVLAQTPLSYMTQGAGGIVLEDLGFPGGVLFCEGEKIGKTCINWLAPVALGKVYTAWKLYHQRDIVIRPTGKNAVVAAFPNLFRTAQSVRVEQNGAIEIHFAEPVSYVSLKLSSLTPSVTIKYYTRKVVDLSLPVTTPTGKWTFGTKLPVFADPYGNPVQTVTKTYLELNNEVVFDGSVFNPDVSIDRIVITPSGCVSSSTYWAGIAANVIAKRTVLQGLLADKQDDADEAREDCDRATLCDSYCTQHCQYCAGTSKKELCDLAEKLEAEVAAIQADIQKLNDFLVQINNGSGPGGGTVECATYLHEVCFLTRTHYEFNLTVPSEQQVRDATEDMMDSLEKIIQPIWRPNTYFAIQIQTEDKIASPGNGPSYTKYHTFGFRTGGPVGHFHKLDSRYQTLLSQNKEDEYKLARLTHYIDYTKSYPNADGSIISAKPLFYREPRLLMFYKHAYIYAMYNNWDPLGALSSEKARLEAIIKDPAEPKFNPPRVKATAQWTADDNPRVEEDVWTINNLLLFGLNCILMTGPIKRPGMHTEMPMDEKTPLEPLKLYSVIMNSIYNGTTTEVHRYVFQTSRYADFKEQISSYILSSAAGAEKYAIYRIDGVVTSTGRQNALDLFGGVSNATQTALKTQYQDRFDRLTDGALRIRIVDTNGNSSVLEPAETLEFNIVTQGTGPGRIVAGLLVRSPEPFNDPKIPDATLATSIRVVNIPTSNPSSEDTNFTLTFSKDGSQVFITNPTMNIAVGTMKITFRYLEYDGRNYVERASETAAIAVS